MAKSEFSVETTTIKWRVCNFSWLDLLESDVFMFDGLQWKFTVEKEEEEEVALFFTLSKMKSRKPARPFTLQMFCKDHNGNLHCKGNYDLNFSGCSAVKFLCRLRIMELTKRLLSDDILTIVFSLTPSDTPQDETEGELEDESSANMNCVEGLSLDIHRLLSDGTQSDVTLKCKGKTIPAHRLILSVRSEVFATKFRNSKSGKQSGIVEITDMDSSTLEQLIQFIYSGKLSDLSMDTAVQLYVAGIKYAVQSLKTRCSDFIEENLTEENACGVLVLADIHNDADLKECVVAFILQSELLQNDDIWLKFCEDHSKLANEVLNRAFKEKFVSK